MIAFASSISVANADPTNDAAIAMAKKSFFIIAFPNLIKLINKLNIRVLTKIHYFNPSLFGLVGCS
jgi:DUF1009 family protein